MTQNIKVTCDECNEVFKINKIKSKRVGTFKNAEVRFNYFNCPKCKKKYFVGASEKTLNKMLARLRHVQKKLRAFTIANGYDGDRHIEEIEELQDESRRLQSEIKSRSDMLKALFVLK